MRTRKNKRNFSNSKQKKIFNNLIIHNKKAVILVSIFIVIIAFFSVIFSLININNTKMLRGIYIDGIDVSNLSKEDAKNKITENLLENITLAYSDIEETIATEEIDLQRDIDGLLNTALNIGKTGNILKDNYDILFTLIFNKYFNDELIYDTEILSKKLDEISNKLPDSVVQSSYYIEDENLIIKKGTSGISINKTVLKDSIENAIKSNDNSIIQIPVENVEPDEIDIEKIYNEIYKEAQDAYINEDTQEIQTHINGVDFAISLEEAKETVQQEGDEYIIPLKITVPEVTLAQITSEAFPYKISEFTTRYDASNKNRSINLQLAANKINGTIIQPGDTFSYNKIVGKRTIEEGYKEATIYSGGKVVQGIGGGICQLSSTLYDAVLYANLEITSRSNHRFLTSYVKEGRDATVSWGTIDFCFKNTRTYPIKIVTSVVNGIAKVEIYGQKEEIEYDVELETQVLETTPYKTTYKNDSSLESGTEVIEQNGSYGVKCQTYKIVKLNGATISKTLLSTDTYSSLECIIRRGTKTEL
jgi:vancomycin resistance protein YoaR